MAEPSTPDLPGLGRFARSGDRRPPPAFVGRRNILDAVEADLEDQLDDWRKGVLGAFAGVTWLLQGAPGAGKTALLTHLAEVVAKDSGARGLKWDAEELSDVDGSGGASPTR